MGRVPEIEIFDENTSCPGLNEAITRLRGNNKHHFGLGSQTKCHRGDGAGSCAVLAVLMGNKVYARHANECQGKCFEEYFKVESAQD